MARAKQTARSEARRRYRQAVNEEGDTSTDAMDAAGGPANTAATTNARSAARPGARSTGTAPARPGFVAAARGAYHPAHIREDLGYLPQLLVSRAMLAAVGLVVVGGAAYLAFPNYTGGVFAWQLLVLPGSALGPQLVAGFFARRASYLLGFIIGLLQGVVFTVLLTAFASQIGTELPADKLGNLLTLSFVTGPISGTLFAAAAAWYRRFLSLSSPRRPPSGRAPAKAAPKRVARR